MLGKRAGVDAAGPRVGRREVRGTEGYHHTGCSCVNLFLNPLDAIPDSLPAFSFFDDSSVVALAFDANIVPIQAFLEWERNDAKWNRPVSDA